MEIDSGIHLLSVGDSSAPGPPLPNVYFILGGDAAAMVDTAREREEDYQVLESYLASIGNPRLSHIILTHRHSDHMGGAAHFQQRSGGAIACAPAEKQAIEENLKGAHVDRMAQDGEILDLSGKTLELIHTPGHTLGSLTILIREQGALFTGDTILGLGNPIGVTEVKPDEGDMALYVDSLRKLQRYDSAVIFPGHGPPVHDSQAKLQELIAHRLEREEQVVHALEKGQQTVQQLRSNIYAELNQQLYARAENQLRAHLIKLEREQRVTRVQGLEEETYALT